MSKIIQPSGHRVTRILSCKIKESRRNIHGDALFGSRTKTFRIKDCTIFSGTGTPQYGQTVSKADLEIGRGTWNGMSVEPMPRTADSNGWTRSWRVVL